MGTPKFTTFGGSLSVNFVNTVQRHRRRTWDLLGSPLAVIQWIETMTQSGWLFPSQQERLVTTPFTDADIPRIAQFREVCRRFLSAEISLMVFQSHLESIINDTPLVFRVEYPKQRLSMGVSSRSRRCIGIVVSLVL